MNIFWKKLNKLSTTLGNINNLYGKFCYQVANNTIQG